MLSHNAHAPVAAYLLADHLDAALAAGEDLIAAGQAWKAITENAAVPNADTLVAERAAVERLRVAELHLVSRLLAGRRNADGLAASDESFAPMAKLFVAGTAILCDAAAELADVTARDFDSADSLMAYVRSRSLLTAECASMTSALSAPLEERFHIAGRIPLNTTLDMVAAFLDAIDVRYDLYGDDDGDRSDDTAYALTTQDEATAPQGDSGDVQDAQTTDDDTGAPADISKPRSLIAALEAARDRTPLH